VRDADASARYVSRGGLKLEHALDAFAIDVAGLVCADLGCSTGGFTDCLLQRGAGRVYAVDTAYGELAWKLRQHERVAVMERTNALHAAPPEKVDLVVVDLGWTTQDRAIPAAMRWLKRDGRIISLIKPHYEIDRSELESLAERGVLPDDVAERVARETVSRLPALGGGALGLTKSPIRGGKAKKKGSANKAGTGNAEWLVLCARDGG